MMRLIELDSDEWENIPIEVDRKVRSLVIEVVSTVPIDLGVVDDEGLKAFEKDDRFSRHHWHERTKGPVELQVDVPTGRRKLWLILWNANSRKDAVVAYRFGEPVEA